MNTFQVSVVRPKTDRLSSKFCDQPTTQPTDKLIIFWFSNIAELQQDYLAKRELEQLIDETETSFTKINESIKTLICVVQKQEKHLLVKTGSKWNRKAFVPTYVCP